MDVSEKRASELLHCVTFKDETIILSDKTDWSKTLNSSQQAATILGYPENKEKKRLQIECQIWEANQVK